MTPFRQSSLKLKVQVSRESYSRATFGCLSSEVGQQRLKKRCEWVGKNNPLMFKYHDREWGVPVHDDARHFEFLVLEGVQAGLSWPIVLNKREGYRRAFSEFDPNKVARYTETRSEAAARSGDHSKSAKIEAAVGNVRAFLAIQEEFGGT
jgi:DNA-3-methyladenine glycosylase I